MIKKFDVKQYQQQSWYKLRDGLTCPMCGADDLEWGEVDSEWAGIMEQPVTCNNCKSRWLDHYRIERFILQHDGLAEQGVTDERESETAGS